MPNSQKKYINIETPEKNSTKQTLQYGTTKYEETYQCRMYRRKLLMMGREDARNM
jgi:hypothetical protein